MLMQVVLLALSTLLKSISRPLLPHVSVHSALNRLIFSITTIEDVQVDKGGRQILEGMNAQGHQFFKKEMGELDMQTELPFTHTYSSKILN
jgi:hypothetical protein